MRIEVTAAQPRTGPTGRTESAVAANWRGRVDVAPTKALHLLRPRLVAASDDYVRGCLRIDEGDATPSGYAARSVAIQQATRRVGQENAAALAALHAYANNLPSVTVPLSKVRVLDMVLWSHTARQERHVRERGLPLGSPRG